MIRWIGGIGLLWAIITHSWAQVNLVPNWSFEEYDSCCTICDEMNQFSFDQVLEWYPKNLYDSSSFSHYNQYVAFNYNSPDYYNPCNTTYKSPDGIYGYQQAFNGLSYAALAASMKDTNDYFRESIRIQLLEKLEVGKQYCAELYWANSNYYMSRINKLGMLFSPDSFYIGGGYGGFVQPGYPKPQFYTPQIYADSILFDTLNWHRLSGSFIANGDEEWLTIGFFFSPLEYDKINVNPSGGAVYYYIDAVKVYECDPVEEDEIILPQLLTPNGDGHNDVYFINDSLPPFTRVWIYNRWGNEVYYSENYQNDWDGTWNGNRLPSGTYFIQVLMPMGTRKTTYIELME